MKVPASIAARSKNEQVAIVAMLGAFVLVLGFASLQILGGGGDEVPEPLPTFSRRPTPTPTTSPLPVIEPAFGRDPFEPLVREGTGGGGPAPTGAPTPGSSGGTTTGGSSRRVSLLDIFRSGGELQATVSVDGTEFTVAEGETFDTSFRLLSLTSRCGTFVFGDERFTLCVGQQVRK